MSHQEPGYYMLTTNVPDGEEDDFSSLTNDERVAKIAEAYSTIISCLGEDPKRLGLLKTPVRAAKSMLFLTAGYKTTLDDVINDAKFDEDISQSMIIVRGISMSSLCEHHLLPFYGKVDIAYVPKDGKVIGLSKLARISEMYARRLQIQERLTDQIAAAVSESVGAEAVAVQISAAHMCMCIRGVEKVGSTTITTAFLGKFHKDSQLRSEFFYRVRSI